MGLWDIFREILFSDKSEDGSSVKVARSNSNRERVTGSKIEPTGGGGHTHRSYNLNTSSGECREYSGGENSRDRSNRKNAEKDKKKKKIVRGARQASPEASFSISLMLARKTACRSWSSSS